VEFPHLIENTGLVSRSGMHEGMGFCSVVKSTGFICEIMEINFFSLCFLLESVSNGTKPVSVAVLFLDSLLCDFLLSVSLRVLFIGC